VVFWVAALCSLLVVINVSRKHVSIFRAEMTQHNYPEDHYLKELGFL
jgi:hypothetical protein